MRPEVMLFVEDVEATSKWYQDFLGMKSAHGGPEYDMLMDGDTLQLQLHQLAADHDHGIATSSPLGNGVLLYIRVDDADTAYARAQELDLPILNELHYNEQAYMREFTVQDPNGYSIGVCQSGR